MAVNDDLARRHEQAYWFAVGHAAASGDKDRAELFAQFARQQAAAQTTFLASIPDQWQQFVDMGEGEGDWECYGCGYHVPALSQGFDTRCPRCGSFELHLTDDAKARRK